MCILFKLLGILSSSIQLHGELTAEPTELTLPAGDGMRCGDSGDKVPLSAAGVAALLYGEGTCSGFTAGFCHITTINHSLTSCLKFAKV